MRTAGSPGKVTTSYEVTSTRRLQSSAVQKEVRTKVKPTESGGLLLQYCRKFLELLLGPVIVIVIVIVTVVVFRMRLGW